MPSILAHAGGPGTPPYAPARRVGFSELSGGCKLHVGTETQLGAKLKRHPNEEGQSGEDTLSEAGENASQLASTVRDYADDDKPWEKEDGK